MVSYNSQSQCTYFIHHIFEKILITFFEDINNDYSYLFSSFQHYYLLIMIDE